MSVQGFGNVGSNTAVILSKLGVSTIAVGDHTGYMYNPEGFNAHKLQDYVEAHGSIAGYPGGKPITREEFFATKADIFAPCALENQIGEAEAKALDVKLVAEGANGPCNPAGEKILLDKGIDILPDVLANSGGVTVSYYEWVQNKRCEMWTEEEVDARLEVAMKRAYREVSDFARAEEVRPARRRVRDRAPAHRGGLQGARDLPVIRARTVRTAMPYVRTRLGRWFYEERGVAEARGRRRDRARGRASSSTGACGASRSSRSRRSGASSSSTRPGTARARCRRPSRSRTTPTRCSTRSASCRSTGRHRGPLVGRHGRRCAWRCSTRRA